MNSAPAATGLSVRAIVDADELAALGPLWAEVQGAAATRSPFLRHEWIHTWWECFGAEHQLLVLLIEDDEGVAAIAPLSVARRHLGPISYRSVELIGTGPLRFLGMGLTDRADFLIVRKPEACLDAIAGHLAGIRDRWDVVDLRFVPATSTTAERLPELARAAGFGVSIHSCAVSPYLPLDGTWDGYLQRRSSNFRKGLKRKLRRLEAIGPVELDLAAEASGAPAVLDAVVEISLASWKKDAGTALFMHANVRDFWERLAPRLAAVDGLYVCLCRVDGELAAHELGFRMDDKLWSYDSCFKDAHAIGSPGILLTARLLEQSYCDGLEEYDFLRGDHGYKKSWLTEEREERQIILDAGHARGRLARRLAFDAKWAIKRHPKLHALQTSLAGRLNRLRSGDGS